MIFRKPRPRTARIWPPPPPQPVIDELDGTGEGPPPRPQQPRLLGAVNAEWDPCGRGPITAAAGDEDQ